MQPGTRAFVVIISVGALFIAKAQAEEKEPIAVVELGGAAEWGLGGGSGFGPSAAVEFSPIKNLLLEAGVAPLFCGGHAEWDADLLVKKSFALSKTVEFEPGVGPAWSSDGKIAGEVSFQFMIWPLPERKFGYFVESSYSYSFSNGHEQSLGMNVGLLIAIP